MRKLVKLVARMPAAATVATTAFLLVTPAAAQDVPSKPAQKAPAQKAPAQKAPAQKAPAQKSPAPKVEVVPRAPEAVAQRPFAEPPAMVPPELEEPEMTGAPESLEKENARSEPRLDPVRPSTVRRARLGAVVGPADVPKALARLGIESGILVKELIEGTPAHLDGMLVGDIITRVEGKRIARATDAVKALSGHAPGKVAVVQVLRDGKPILLRLKLDQGTKVVKRSSRREDGRRLRRHHLRSRMKMRQWQRDLRRRHQLRMRQLRRLRY